MLGRNGVCRIETESMTRSLPSRMVRPAIVLLLVAASSAWGSDLYVRPGARMRFAAPMRVQGNRPNYAERPAPNAGRPGAGARPAPNGMNRPGAINTLHRPEAQQHLGEWMEAHRSLSPQQQQNALEAEPGFRELRPEEQQRMHNQLTRLNAMSPEQRQRTIARTEWMEHLAPQERQQVNSALRQLGSLPQDRSFAVGRAFRSVQGMPPMERQAYLNSPQFRSQFNDQERGTLNNLLNVSPLLPPPNLGMVH